jgi:hypothetical protein
MTTKKVIAKVAIVAILIILALLVTNVVFFEDGSAAIQWAGVNIISLGCIQPELGCK